MNYALIDENGLVTNIVYLEPEALEIFPNAVLIDEVPIGIGDRYLDGKFYRNEEVVGNIMRDFSLELLYKESIIAELDAALLDATYENLNDKF